MKHKWLTVALCLCIVLTVISAAIALPIYFRPFYYWQMDALGVTERTGYDKATIVAAYDEVLNYLTIPGREFGTGAMPHSAEGASHFADCRVLFFLNNAVFLVSVAGLLLLWLLHRRGWFRLCYPKGRHPATWCGGGILLTFGLLGGLVALNFDMAFTVFHKVFFWGKTNWILDPHTDPFVDALPPNFFLNCGVLILSCVVLASVFLLIYGHRHRKKI